MIGVIVGILVIAILIFFHELGHFLVAKMCGARVEIFSIGFGRKLCGFVAKGTQYRLSIIPLGGYVKIKGIFEETRKQQNNPSLLESQNSINTYKKILILLAGSLFNFLLGFICYFCINFYGFDTLAPVVGSVSEKNAKVLRQNDEILKIDGKLITQWQEIKQHINASKEPSISVQIKRIKDFDSSQDSTNTKREEQILDVEIKPILKQVSNIFGEQIEQRLIGITPSGEVRFISFGFLDSMKKALIDSIEASKFITLSLQKIITGVVGVENISGVVGMVDILSKTTKDAHSAREAFTGVLSISAIISINLGLLNLLPIPMLDGAHIFNIIYRKLLRHEISYKFSYVAKLIGFSLLCALMLLGLYNDIFRILN